MTEPEIALDIKTIQALQDLKSEMRPILTGGKKMRELDEGLYRKIEAAINKLKAQGKDASITFADSDLESVHHRVFDVTITGKDALEFLDAQLKIPRLDAETLKELKKLAPIMQLHTDNRTNLEKHTKHVCDLMKIDHDKRTVTKTLLIDRPMTEHTYEALTTAFSELKKLNKDASIIRFGLTIDGRGDNEQTVITGEDAISYLAKQGIPFPGSERYLSGIGAA